jgi:hypothetical protein
MSIFGIIIGDHPRKINNTTAFSTVLFISFTVGNFFRYIEIYLYQKNVRPET